MSAQAALFGHFHQKSFNIETLRRSGHFSQRSLNWVKRVILTMHRLLPVFHGQADNFSAARHVPNVPITDIASLDNRLKSEDESASLIGRLGSSAFRLSTTTVSMSLAGSCFFFGIGTRALPSWDSK